MVIDVLVPNFLFPFPHLSAVFEKGTRRLLASNDRFRSRSC
jgi:hypothetical protein